MSPKSAWRGLFERAHRKRSVPPMFLASGDSVNGLTDGPVRPGRVKVPYGEGNARIAKNYPLANPMPQQSNCSARSPVWPRSPP